VLATRGSTREAVALDVQPRRATSPATITLRAAGRRRLVGEFHGVERLVVAPRTCNDVV
jgi:hypothetical protein